MDDIKINFVDANKEERIISDSFYNWFKNQLIVSYFPKVQMLETFDVIINVSDEYSQSVSKYCIENKKQYFWFPMSECNSNMGLHSIYGALNILKICEEQNLKVLLHCHAGANRSPSVKESYYIMKTGELFSEEKTQLVLRNIQFGYLPSFYEYKQFLNQIYLNQTLDMCFIKSSNHK